MSRLRKHAMAVLAALTLGGAMPVDTALGFDEPVRVITMPSPERRASEARDLLGSQIGTATATSGVTVPDDEAARTASRLSRVAAASRQYGAVRISVFEMADESVAYALLRFLRPEGAERVDLGDDAWASSGKTLVRQGAFTAVLSGGSSETRAADAASLVERIGRRPLKTQLVRQLPDTRLVESTERYAPSFEALRRLRPDLQSDVYRFGAGGADAVFADYEQPGAAPMHLLIVDYQTPQLAADAERGMTAYYESLSPEVKEHRIFKRVGNFLVEATDVTDRAAAEAVLASVKYDVAIKMLKGDDTEAIRNFTEEARKAALVFINSFAIVGLSFLVAIASGLVVGAVVFTRRRRASANRFSDAGGMVHLELEPPQLPPGKSAGLLSGGGQ